MALHPMERDTLRQFVTESDGYGYAVVLVSGEWLYGDRVGTDGDELVLEQYGYGHEETVAVPADEVAGVGDAPLRQTREPAASPPPAPYTRNSPMAVSLYETTRSVAEERGYEVTPLYPMYDLAPPDDFAWGAVEFTEDTPLYCDWDHLSRRSGGLTSLGAGGFGFSVSAGWDESLWSAFRATVERTTVPLGVVGERSEATTESFVNFVEVDGASLTREMDGSEWIGAVLSETPVSDASELTTLDWAFAFFKRDGLMIPLDSWEHITDALAVFTEKVESRVQTGFGERRFYLKARATAYLS